MSIQMGQRVRDKISGFKGIAVARTTYLNGCDRISVQAKVNNDGEVPEVESFDEPDIESLEPKPTFTGDGTKTGGPHGHKGYQLRR